ncbi:MAG: hypothetical protein LBR56_01170, partial [Sporomusaceae bacterium]|nr:hypothetical protein [Sporomusaceae bacterium]
YIFQNQKFYTLKKIPGTSGGRKLFRKSFLPPHPHLSKIFSSLGRVGLHPGKKTAQRRNSFLLCAGVTAVAF